MSTSTAALTSVSALTSVAALISIVALAAAVVATIAALATRAIRLPDLCLGLLLRLGLGAALRARLLLSLGLDLA